jgi:hypothetical protein
LSRGSTDCWKPTASGRRARLTAQRLFRAD